MITFPVLYLSTAFNMYFCFYGIISKFYSNQVTIRIDLHTNRMVLNLNLFNFMWIIFCAKKLSICNSFLNNLSINQDCQLTNSIQDAKAISSHVKLASLDRFVPHINVVYGIGQKLSNTGPSCYVTYSSKVMRKLKQFAIHSISHRLKPRSGTV